MDHRYRLFACPSLIPDGPFLGELRGIAFVAISAADTQRWFAINCGQFETAFDAITSPRAASELFESLANGEAVEFPGDYEPEQFGGGFHYAWSPPRVVRVPLGAPLPPVLKS